MKLLLSWRAALAYAFAVLLLILGFTPANAADAASATVVIPWGSWVSSLLADIAGVAILVLTWVVGKFAPAFVKTFLTDDLIGKAVNYGFAAVEGVVAGKALTLETTNSVLAAAESYAVAAEPKIAAWVGVNLRPLILAKLSALGAVPAEASASSTGATVSAK